MSRRLAGLVGIVLAALALAPAAPAQQVDTSVPLLGRTLKIDYTSAAGNRYDMLAASPPMISVTIPGIAGTLRLNLASLLGGYPGRVPAWGTDRRRIFIPGDPRLAGLSFDLQALDTGPGPVFTFSNAVERTLTTIRGRHPNLVVILADDLGYGGIGAYGNQDIPTPNIDSIAANGAKFTDGYVTGPVCAPTRAGLLTGRYQHRFGFEYNTGPLARQLKYPIGLDLGETTLADHLDRHGYATGIMGKWHQGAQTQFRPLERGFERFFGFLIGATTYFPSPQRGNPPESGLYRDRSPVEEPDYLTDAFAREAVAFIDRHRQVPFFLYVPFNAVHRPLQAPLKYLRRFSHVADPRRRTYMAMTSALDDAVGAILGALRRHGLEQNTLVVFLSDNGAVYDQTSGRYNRPLRFGKGFLFDGGVRVPFLMQWPAAIRPGTVFTPPVQALDLLPTLLAAAGVDRPPGVDGVDLLPHVTGTNPAPPHSHLFWRQGTVRAVRSGKWKMIKTPTYVWLFDLSTDPGEKTNLASANPQVVKQLEAALAQWEAQLEPPAWPNTWYKVIWIDGVKYEIYA